MLNNVSWLRVSARPLITDVTTHRAPSLDGFQHFRFYCSNFAVKYLLIIADILVITYTGELMFNIMICNITKIRIRLSICTSSEVVLSSICSLTVTCIPLLNYTKDGLRRYRLNAYFLSFYYGQNVYMLYLHV